MGTEMEEALRGPNLKADGIMGPRASWRGLDPKLTLQMTGCRLRSGTEHPDTVTEIDQGTISQARKYAGNRIPTSLDRDIGEDIRDNRFALVLTQIGHMPFRTT